ncbi:hypothetical protein J3Q64DRAFT_1739441 [Phycomyces blakesleeanus]
MNGLKDSQMLSVSFPGAHPLGGIRLDGQVGIYNPSSVISLTLGNVDFGIYLPPGHDKSDDDNDNEDQYKEEEEVLMAIVRADDAHLLGQRVNMFNVSGRSIPVPKNGQKRMEQLISAYIHGNTSFVHVRGSSFGPDDSFRYSNSTSTSISTPAWLRKALQSVTLRVPFPGTRQTDLIQSIKFSNLNIDLSKGNSSPLISGDAVAILKKPDEMQISLNVTQIDPLVYLYLRPDSEDPFASLAPDKPCPAKTIEGTNGGNGGSDEPQNNMFKVLSRIEKAPFTVMPGKEDEFKKFLEKVFYRKTSTVYFKGTTSAVVDSALGVLNIRDLPFKGEIDTKGMEGMKEPSPTVEAMTVVRGYQESLHAVATLVIYNPSDVHVNLGAINMLLIYNNQIIGNASLPDLALAPVQNNRVKAYVWLHHGHSLSSLDNYPLAPTENPKPLIDFIGQYLALENVNLTISGKHPHASSSKILLPLLKQFVFTTSPPILAGPPLLKNTQVNLLSSTAVLWLQNPFPNLAIQILRIHAKANYREDEVGTIDVDFTDKGTGMNGPLLLPACNDNDGDDGDGGEECAEQETQKLPVITKKVGLDAIKKAIGGKIQLSIDSTVDVLVDAFLLEHLRYVRDNVTATIHRGF